MATIRFRVRSNENNKQVPIKIRVNINRNNRIELKTGFSVNTNDWSDAKHLPKPNVDTNKKLLGHLKKLETYILTNLNTDLAKGVIIDKYWVDTKIKECFKRVEKTDDGLVLNHIQYIIDNANTRKVKGRNKLGLSANRIKGYNTFKNLFEIYQSKIKKEVNFLDINKTFVDRFINWLRNEKKYSVNYSGKQIDNLKTVCNDAQALNIPVNPYTNQIQGFSEEDDDRYIQTLSFKEIEQIRDKHITKPELVNARKWLLLGCETGQRVGDLMNITNDNIRYERGNIYLDIIQQKTGKSITVGIIAPHVIEIIENELPHKISIQKLNEYIKEVCKVAEIDEVVKGRKLNKKTRRKELGDYPKYKLITSHSFRRSFATNYYKKVPTAILINITGHSKESLFLKYINQREDKDANADLFMKFYEDIHKEKKPQLKVIKRA
jgi:integrase